MNLKESDMKAQIKDYLAIKGIYNFPLVQGMGSHRGSPDRIMHYQSEVHYLEIKTEQGKMSDYQIAFQEQCKEDGIPYLIIRTIEELVDYVESL